MSEQNGSTIDDTMKSGSKKTGAEKTQSAVNKFNKAKKNISRIRSIKSLAWLTSLIGTIGSVLLVIFLLIGAIGFLVTLPGLAMDKVKEACEGFFKWCFGDQSIKVESDDINNLAHYIEDLGYDLVGYGFASSNSIDADGNINLDNEDTRQNLLHYVLANERTYTLQGTEGGAIVSLFGGVSIFGDLFNLLDSGIRSIWPTNQEYYGMLNFESGAFDWSEGTPKKGNFDVSIDRENNEMLITTKSGFLGINRDQMKWNLSGWTSRYGKPIELSLALHLSTMAPDFVYDFCSNKDLQTRVNIGTHQITYHYEYYYLTASGKKVWDSKIIEQYKKICKEQLDRFKKVTNKDMFYTNNESQVIKFDDNEENNLKKIIPADICDTNILEIHPTTVDEIKDGNNYCKAVDEQGKPVNFLDNLDQHYTIKSNKEKHHMYFEKSDDGFTGKDLLKKSLSGGQKLDERGVRVKADNGSEYIVRLYLLSLKDLSKLLKIDTKEQLGYDKNSLIKNQFKSRDSKGIIYASCIYSRKYTVYFDELDTVISPAEYSTNSGAKKTGIMSEKYIDDAKKLELKLEFNHYEYDEENKMAMVKNKITYENISRLSKDERIHNSSDMWIKACNELTETPENMIKFLTGNANEEGFIELIQKEAEQIRSREVEITANSSEADKNYIKVLVLFSADLQTFLNDNDIDVELFMRLYDIFDDLQNSKDITTYKPYIKTVTNHWYKDLNFENEGTYKYEEIKTKRNVKFTTGGAAQNDKINKMEGKLYYEETVKEGNTDIIQAGQPQIIKTKSWHYMVKNWIVYGYYFIYDGSVSTAKKIEKALDLLKDDYDPTNPLLIEVTDQEGLYKGNISSDEIDNKAKQLNQKLKENGFDVRLRKISFEKKSSLQAFSMLEAMHTEDSEYIYRDLKEFLIELGYFTRADFESVETDVFKWIIQGYNVYKDEWPDTKYEKNKNEYGTYIRSAASLEEQRKKEAKEEKKADNSNSKINFTTSGDGYNSTTTVNGITYKNYKQFSGSYAGYYYWGNSDPNNIGSNSTADPNSMAGSGCGPTTAAVVLSGYGIDKGPWDVAQIMIKSCKGITNGTDLKNAMNSLGCKVEHYSIDGNKGIEEAKSNIKKALLAGKPVLAVTNTASGGYHYVTLLGIDSDENVIISDVGNVNNNYKGTVEDFVEKLMGNCSYIIPEKAPSGITTNQEVVGFESGKNVVMPETGKITKIGNRDEDSKNEKNEKNENKTNNTQENKEKDYFATNGDYIRIEFNTGNGVNGWSMEIEGFSIDKATIQEGQELKKGECIGKTVDDSNIKIILYDNNNAIINNVEDYFKLQARKKNNSGTAGSLEDLGVMILTMEGGMDSYSEGDYWKVIEDSFHKGDTMCYTAGGSGVTNWCKQEFIDTGHEDLYPMELNTLVPKQAILEVKAKVTENKYNAVKSKLQELGVTDWTETQILAFTSATYNGAWNDFVDVIKEYKDGDKDKAKWMFLSIYNANGIEAPGLKYRRAVEWDIFENGANFEYTEERKQECYRKYYTNFYYTHSY